MLLALLALLMAAQTGCSTYRTTNPGRTATEQFLMSEAAIKAVDQLSFDALRGRTVFIDSTYFVAAEQDFAIGELRARCLNEGATLAEQRDKAQIIVEIRSGGIGIDRYDFLLGIPQFALSLGGDEGEFDVPVVTPEIAFIKNIRQKGYASVAFVAFWRDTGEVVASSGPFIGKTTREDWWFFGFGPRTIGNIPTVDNQEE